MFYGFMTATWNVFTIPTDPFLSVRNGTYIPVLIVLIRAIETPDTEQQDAGSYPPIGWAHRPV